MSHIFFIDPIEKLNIKKDSSLMMAMEFKNHGHEVYILFEKDFFVTNQNEASLDVYSFDASHKEDGYYLEYFELKEKKNIPLGPKDVIHMRIDPPFDTRYQRYLWMLDFLEHQCAVKVVNNPIGIMKHNEKLAAFKRKDASVNSYIGGSVQGLKNYLANLKDQNITDLIMKPLDLYSGIGVEKVSMSDPLLMSIFQRKVQDYKGAIVVQPFLKEVHEGEYRSLYFFGKEVGTILKKPNPGEYLANIAQGAKYAKATLPDELKKVCDEIASEFMQDGVPFIAFDLLGEYVQEINVTCPGLLVEVSYAIEENLAHKFATMFAVDN